MFYESFLFLDLSVYSKMTFPSFCLCIAAIVFLTDAKSMTQKLLNLDVHTKNLQNLHVQFQKLTKAKGYLLTVS